MANNVSSSSWWQALCLNPFRLFFPLGILAGCVGVGSWALWTTGISVGDIKKLHLILQSQGFLLMFVIGFLMTALPRFSGTAPAEKVELVLAFLSSAFIFYGAAVREWVWAHAGTLGVLSVMAIFAARRFPYRTKDPPPSFVLIGFGILHLAGGVVVSLVGEWRDINPVLYGVGRQMVQLGFLTCMVLAITAKLAPFLMGYTNEPGCDEIVGICKKFKKNEVFFHGFVGLGLFASFLFEPNFPRFCFFLRAVLVTVHFLLFAKIGRVLKKKTATILFFWVSCWMIPLGSWTVFFLPQYKVAALHLIFIGGFSLMIFSFGFLVVLSHSQKAALLNGKLWVLKSVGLLILLALGFRVSADFIPSQYMLFLHNASGFWVVAAVVWVVYLIPKMRGVHHEH